MTSILMQWEIFYINLYDFRDKGLINNCILFHQIKYCDLFCSVEEFYFSLNLKGGSIINVK